MSAHELAQLNIAVMTALPKSPDAPQARPACGFGRECPAT